MTAWSLCYGKIIKNHISSTYLYVDDCAVVHPHREYSILENHSELIQELLFQSGTVKLLTSTGNTQQSRNITPSGLNLFFVLMNLTLNNQRPQVEGHHRNVD